MTCTAERPSEAVTAGVDQDLEQARIARAVLERWIRAATTPQRVVRRASIVLLAMDGVPVDRIAVRLRVSRPTVKLWIERFETGGPPSLEHDAPGRGRRPSVDAAAVRDRLAAASLLDSTGNPLSLRRAAAFLNVSRSAVWRGLRRARLPVARPQQAAAAVE